MVDTTNPTSQFHPYQPQDAIPVSERQKSGGLGGILGSLGIDRSKLYRRLKQYGVMAVKFLQEEDLDGLQLRSMR